MTATRRRELVLVAVIASVALMLRVAYISELSGDVLFEHPPLDEGRYTDAARKLATGFGFEKRPFWQPPGMLLVIATCLRWIADTLWAPRLLQALVGALTCCSVWIWGRRAVGPRAALAASAICAFHGSLIFASGELLAAVWIAALDIAALTLLLDARRSYWHACGAGVLLGLSALFAPVVLPFAAASCVWLLYRAEQRAIGVAFGIALLLPIVPVAIRNSLTSDSFVLLSTNGGLNLFIGNNPHYLETLAIRPGPRWVELTQAPLREAGISEPAAASAWFTKQAMSFWSEQPGSAFVLTLRKVWLFFHAIEIPRDTDIYALRAESSVLSLLVGPKISGLPNGLLIPLAAVGMAMSIRTQPKLRLGVLFIVSHALTYALFFPAARYRIPCLPVLAVFAVLGVQSLVCARSKQQRLSLLASALLLALVFRIPTAETSFVAAAERELYRGLAERQLGNEHKAMHHFKRAIRNDRADPRAWAELKRMESCSIQH